MGKKRRLPSPALAISVLALVVAVGGGSYALALNKRQTRRVVVRVSRRIANRRIRRLAPGLSVAHADTAATATSAGTAASADHASSADTATSAGHAASADTAASAAEASHAVSADTAGTAETAGVAGHAYTAYHDGEVSIPHLAYGTVGTLHIPQPGAYVILAKLFVNNHSSGIEYAAGSCKLIAPGASDLTDFTVGPTFENVTEAIALQVTPVLTAAADVTIQCEYFTDSGTADIKVAWQKITAIQVAGRTSTGF